MSSINHSIQGDPQTRQYHTREISISTARIAFTPPTENSGSYYLNTPKQELNSTTQYPENTSSILTNQEMIFNYTYQQDYFKVAILNQHCHRSLLHQLSDQSTNQSLLLPTPASSPQILATTPYQQYLGIVQHHHLCPSHHLQLHYEKLAQFLTERNDNLIIQQDQILLETLNLHIWQLSV